MSLLPRFAAEGLQVTPVAYWFNGPVWTLHLEFVGSFLVAWAFECWVDRPAIRLSRLIEELATTKATTPLSTPY